MTSILDNISSIKKEKSKNGIIFYVNESLDDTFFLPSIEEEVDIILAPNTHLNLLEKDVPNFKRRYHLKEGSTLRHNFLVLDSLGKENRIIEIDENASWDAAYADFSSKNNNIKIDCYLNDKGARGIFHLASLARHEVKKIFDINFTHNAPFSESQMENYGVVRDASTLFFIGTSHIKKGAYRSNAKQSSKIMVFDPKCHVSASPILRIDENDVLATHAAAEGRINEEHMFYLMSRGLKEEEAKRIITLGYLNPILPLMFDEKIRKEVENIILERM